MNELARRGGRPTFDEVYARLQGAGPATVVSSKGTTYTVTAEVRDRGRVIEARPRSSKVSVHEDCWGDDENCLGSRMGGIYNGDPSIYDWYDSVG